MFLAVIGIEEAEFLSLMVACLDFFSNLGNFLNYSFIKNNENVQKLGFKIGIGSD
jgi:hypothetical protein